MAIFVNRFMALLLLLFSQGARGDLLVCLGQEELGIHRSRESGPIYYLNQFFINRFASGKKVILSGEYQKRICGKGVASPSVALLKYLLVVGNRIFVNSSKVTLTEREAFRAFFVFLLKIQKIAPHHRCLEKHLPHYSYFTHRYKYLEVMGVKLLKEKDKLMDMFRVLERLDVLLEKCRSNDVKRGAGGKL